MSARTGAVTGRLVVAALVTLIGPIACARSYAIPFVQAQTEPYPSPAPTLVSPTEAATAAVETLFPTALPAGALRSSPTPDPVRDSPELRTEQDLYVVQPGDSLNEIASRFGVGVQQLMVSNGLWNPNYLAVGQVLVVPASEPLPPGPTTKLIPDSEVVYGPSTASFSTIEVVEAWQGALHDYREEVDGQERQGGQIVQMVAQRYSVHPKLLLALLEYQGGWLTQPRVEAGRQQYPVGYVAPGKEGLFSQISWAADQINSGFYRWRAGWNGPFLFTDGRVAPPGGGINAGTVALQYLFSQLYDAEEWRGVVSEEGFIRDYKALFGDPFDWAIEPLLPADLEQPPMQLPFEEEAVWSFTSGPHSAWGEGSAWAALDFAPPGFALGCVQSPAWIVAIGEGPVVRTEMGIVVQDMDGDGREGTGWSVLYLHVESRDRIEEGVTLQSGQRIGHPSCEGGVSSGTHLHLARKYNGVWIEADGAIPFNLDGWVSSGTGLQYDGQLTRDGETREACSCRDETNQVQR